MPESHELCGFMSVACTTLKPLNGLCQLKSPINEKQVLKVEKKIKNNSLFFWILTQHLTRLFLTLW